MRARGRARLLARLMCAACVLAPVAAAAQELDPSAPLEPLPDLGVEWPNIGQEPAETPSEAPPVAAASDETVPRRYSVAVEGLEQLPGREEILDAFDAGSALAQNEDERTNAAQVDRRTGDDVELLTELLRARGYYDAVVEPRLDSTGDALRVMLVAQPGQQYTFSSVELPGLAAAGAEADALRAAFDVQAGDPVNAAEVIAAGVALKVALGEQGFATAEVGERQVEIDHETRTASLVLPVEPGPLARFGEVRVSGEPPFDAKHIITIARFEPGDPFQRSKVDDLRRALVATGLVSSAEVRVIPSADPRVVDLAVELQPAPMRTIAGELGYGTGEGFRVEASWQHRNFFNPEGALTLRGVAGTKEQVAAVELRRNNFRRRDQVLNLLASASNIDRKAYEARTLLLSANVERQSNIVWQKAWTYGLGIDLIATDERGVFGDPTIKETRTFLIGALPAHLRYDGSNDLLNPTEGFRLGGRISPELSAHGGSFAYARAQLDGSAYYPVSSSTVLAGRVRVGTILGADSASIAPSRRFYSGGGGSVRGYGYQQLGPQDAFGDPIGGRGLAEFSLEARYRLKAFGGNFGIVPFIDGGTLSRDQLPDMGAWQFGAGIGLRYYSSFGPIRIDIGVPLNRREGDAPVAVAVSLGQAF